MIKKLPAVLLVLLVVLFTCGKSPKVVSYDKLEQKGELFYLKGKIQPFSGTAVEYYPDGKTRATEFNYENGKRQGPALMYHEDGSLSGEFAFVNGVGSGTMRQFYKNGQKELEVEVVDGKKEGIERQWYENGMKKSEITYKQGSLNGRYMAWDMNGNIIQNFEARQQ
jgi:antitoxin component YwqK of YwqJK toxin-antitoxin module